MLKLSSRRKAGIVQAWGLVAVLGLSGCQLCHEYPRGCTVAGGLVLASVALSLGQGQTTGQPPARSAAQPFSCQGSSCR